MPNPADEEQLKATIVSAKLLCAGLAAAEFSCLLAVWIAPPHRTIAYLSVWIFCFSIPVLANWLLLAQQDDSVEISRISLHLTAWAMIFGAIGLFIFLLGISIVGAIIFAASSVVSLFHFNDRNEKLGGAAKALAGPITDLFNQGKS